MAEAILPIKIELKFFPERYSVFICEGTVSWSFLITDFLVQCSEFNSCLIYMQSTAYMSDAFKTDSQIFFIISIPKFIHFFGPNDPKREETSFHEIVSWREKK